MPRQSSGPHLSLRKQAGAEPIYYIRWTEGGISRKTSTGAGDLPAAEKVFAAWLAERQREERIAERQPRDPASILVTDILGDYLIDHGSKVAAPETLAYAVDPMIVFFTGKTIADLTPERAKDYWAWRRLYSVRTLPDDTLETFERGAGDGTIIRELAGTLRPAIQHAIAEKRLVPGEYYVPVPPRPRGRDYWITRSDAARLVWETRRDPRARLHLPLYALIALYTGARRGAILDLTWPQIDLVGGIIDFNPAGRPETKKKRPKIPVPPSLLAHLKRAQRRATSNYVIAYRGERVDDVKTGFNSAANRAGIRGCTSHTLRHTAGTWMAQRGVPLFQIAGYLGHSVQRTTELYAHHHPDHLKDAVAAFRNPNREPTRARPGKA